jgi:hypothetical protein
MAELWSVACVVSRTALPADHCGSAVDGRVESPYQRFRDASMLPTITTISWGPQHGRVRTIPSVARQGCPTRLSRSWRCIGAFSVLGARAAKSTARREASRGAQSGRRLAGHEVQRMGTQLCAKATKPHSLSHSAGEAVVWRLLSVLLPRNLSQYGGCWALVLGVRAARRKLVIRAGS